MERPVIAFGLDWTRIQNDLLLWLPDRLLRVDRLPPLEDDRDDAGIKPQSIQPKSASSVRWEDVAGLQGAKRELHEVVEFLREPERFESSAPASRRASSLRPPAPARRCSRRRSRTSPARASSPRALPRCRDVARPRRGADQEAVRAGARKNTPRDRLIDELDAVGRLAAAAASTASRT